MEYKNDTEAEWNENKYGNTDVLWNGQWGIRHDSYDTVFA